MYFLTKLSKLCINRIFEALMVTFFSFKVFAQLVVRCSEIYISIRIGDFI